MKKKKKYLNYFIKKKLLKKIKKLKKNKKI